MNRDIEAGRPIPRLDLAEQLAKLQQSPTSGFTAGTFSPTNLGKLDFPGRAKLIQQINASREITEADKPRISGELLQRIKGAGLPIEPPAEAFTAKSQFPTFKGGFGFTGTIPTTTDPAEVERLKALQQAYLEAMYGQFPVGPQLP
jgi:hypothetical protein